MSGHFRWKRFAVSLAALSAAGVLAACAVLSSGRATAPAMRASRVVLADVAPGTAPAEKGITADEKHFIQDNCTDCHNADLKSGRLDLTSLAYAPDDRGNFALWVKVHDRVEKHEMPPKNADQPDDAARGVFVKAMGDTFRASEALQMAGEGRAVQRRMNRYEYENALRDLLDLPMAQLKEKLPQDGEAYRFNKSGEALDISFVQMQRFMSTADFAMKLALSEQMNRMPTATTKMYARDVMRGWVPRENGTLPDRLSFPVLDSHAQPDVRVGRAPASSEETREREAVGKVASIFSDAGGYSWGGFRAPIAGKYHVRVAGYSIWVGGGGIGRWFYYGQGQAKAPTYYLPLWHRPNLDEVYQGRNNEPIGIYAQSSGQVRQVGSIDFTPKPTVSDADVELMAGEVIQTDAMRFFHTRVNGSDEQYVNPLATPDGMPGVAMQWVEVTGPIYTDPNLAPGADGTPPKESTPGYRLLFGDLPLKRLEPGQQGLMVDAPAAARGGFGGRGGAPAARGGAAGGRGGAGRGGRGGGGSQIAMDVVTDHPKEDAERLLRTFLNHAYRRPVEEADVQRFLALYNDQMSKGFGFAQSMITTYTAVLASPGFVFIEEKPGKLDDYALATRLSLFLWNSTPDETLRQLAASGQLSKPEVLRQQTDRMLADPKSSRFVEAFTDYWLDIRKIDDTSPSTTLYNDYELDDPLKLAAIDETRLFFAELVRGNLPAKNVVDSDFTFLNERLAEHYGVPGVVGSQMRKVTLPADSERGGVMTMASILKVTANGTTTSPVIRGHWITEHILGIDTPPPPPSVKVIEPDIRGAVTIRQQLDKHRADPTCASCHSVMDPTGFALESFDIMGAQRDRYRAASADVAAVKGYGMDGQAFQFHYGLPVDSAGNLPDGRKFTDARGIKKLLLTDEPAIARNLVQQLSIYATGSPVRFSDREQIEAIMKRAQASDYGVKSIIEETVQSDLFQSK